MDISKKILSDPINKWVFRNAGTDVYLVGGYIRDFLLGRDAHDKDYVLKRTAKQIAVKFAKKFDGTFIELKEELTYRVALRDGQFIDFNNLEQNIEVDLLLRDYTINAIAWSPDTGIIDPAGGVLSLGKRRISTISPENLQKDPLRVLRAYRIAAELNFTIDSITRTYLKKYSPSLIYSSPERITEELYKLLNAEDSLKYLKFCGQDGILKTLFNVTLYNIKGNLALLTIFDIFIKYSNEFIKLEKPISQGLSRLGLIRLSLLLSNNKNISKTCYFKCLAPSNTIKQKVRELQNAHNLHRGRITDSKLYEIYVAAGTSVYETALIMASMRTRKRDRQRFINMADHYLKICKRPLIDGNEIQRILKIKEGTLIGLILGEVKEGQFMGFFNNQKVVRDWIISNFT